MPDFKAGDRVVAAGGALQGLSGTVVRITGLLRKTIHVRLDSLPGTAEMTPDQLEPAPPETSPPSEAQAVRAAASRSPQELVSPQPPADAIEVRLAALAECGLRLAPGVSISELAASWGRDRLDQPGWGFALICLGMESEINGRPHSTNVWHFDTECIEDHGDYVRIAARMADMTLGGMVLTDVKDFVDIEAGSAWLEFKCEGQDFHIDCEVTDDWVDTKLFRHFVDILAARDPQRLFFYFNLGGQDCIIGCLERTQYARLRDLIPEVEPLS